MTDKTEEGPSSSEHQVAVADVDDSKEAVILKNLLILPPLQKDGSVSSADANELKDAVPLPPIRAEEPVSSIRAALGDIYGYAHLTNYRFVLVKNPRGNEVEEGKTKKASKSSSSSSSTKQKASPYTGQNAVISIPLNVKSLNVDDSSSTTATVSSSNGKSSCTGEKEIVLDEFGDMTLFLDEGLEDGSAFRIVLERYDVASIRDHVTRLRSLLDGNAPNTDTLEDESSPKTDNQPSDEKNNQQTTDPADDVVSSKESKNKDEKQDTDSKNENGKEQKQEKEVKISLEDLPIFSPTKSVTPNVNDLKHFFYYACGEDPELYLDNAKNLDSTRKDGGTKSKKNRKKKNNTSKTNSNGVDGESDESFGKDDLPIKEIIPRLNELEEKTRVPCCVNFSGFHPPPQFRRLMGDLAYLEVTLPGGGVVHITATTMGFYVNKSSSSSAGHQFNPSPAAKPCFSHELLDCLLQYSEDFVLAWDEAVSASKIRSEYMAKINRDGPFMSFFRVAIRGDFPGYEKPSVASAAEGIDSLIQNPSWLVPVPRVEEDMPDSWTRNCEHTYSLTKTEQDLSSSYGVDIRAGSLRDWNEELQIAREMPIETLDEKVERAKVLNKVLSDFGEAALLGVRAISDGLVSPMNPNEAMRSQVYLHNNIFFSRAVDSGIETFKVAKGDKAARKSASRDLHCLGSLHRMERTGLHTLATVLVDYFGTRFVCQSILPGILNGEKTHTLLYGAVEAGTPLMWDKEMHDLFETSLGKSLMIATRKMAREPLTLERAAEVEAAKKASPLFIENLAQQEEEKKEEELGPTIELCAPLEAKGIRGSDQRKYVLDMTRLTPRDANWIPKEKGGTGRWEAHLEKNGPMKSRSRIPDSLDDDEWTLAILRGELVSNYAQRMMGKYLRERKASEADDKEQQQPSQEEPQAEKKGLSDDDLAYLKSLRYNINVFLPYIRTLEGIDEDAFEQLKKDEEMVRNISSHLWDDVLPGVTQEIRQGSLHSVPHDGRSLTDFLHHRGINCRYLGQLAFLACSEEDRDREQFVTYNKKQGGMPLDRRKMPLFWLELLECEMVARAAKHVLDSYLSSNGASAASMPAQTIASFLSALVSESEESAAQTENRTSRREDNEPDEDDYSSLTFYQCGGHGDSVPSPVKSRYEVWNDIENEIGRRFRYTLTIFDRPGKSERTHYLPLLRRLCQRTGVRLVAKRYNIGGKCLCGTGGFASQIIASYPISALDIVDIVPLMKHAAAFSSSAVPCGIAPLGGLPPLHIMLQEARTTLEAAILYHNKRMLSKALDLAQEAATLYQRVTENPAHPGLIRCIDLMGSILYDAGEPVLAAANAARALGFQVQISGFDSPDVINLHYVIFQHLLSAGEAGKAVKHIRAAIYLMELIGGPNHLELPNAYHKAGSVYHGANDLKTALQFYQEASSRDSSDRLVDGMILKSSAIVLANLGDFKKALSTEKQAFRLLSAIVGEGHSLTKQTEDNMKKFMQAAVAQGSRMVDDMKKKQEEAAAEAIAIEIVAEEAAEEEKRKKKNQKKKKGKK